jgi:hypothetical protein
MLGYTWKTRGIIFLTNLAVIALFVGLGYALDRIFDKRAFFIFRRGHQFNFINPTVVLAG